MKKKNKNQSKNNNNQNKKFVTIKGIDQIIKQDDLKGFTNFIKYSNLSFKEALFASDKLSYQVGKAKLPLMVSIVHQDALKIFKAVEKEVPKLYKQEFVYQDNRPQPLLNHALKANGTKLLKYLIEKPNSNLFFAERRVSEDKEFSIIHNLMFQLRIEFMLLQTKKSKKDSKEDEKYVSLYLDKLDLILGILKDKDKEFLSSIFHHGNDDSILGIALQIPRPNTENEALINFQQKLLIKLIDWMSTNGCLDFFTRTEISSLWVFENETINSLIDKAKSNNIGVKLERGIDFDYNNIIYQHNSTSNFKNVEAFSETTKNIEITEEIGKYRSYDWQKVKNDFYYSSYFEEHKDWISLAVNINQDEEGSFQKLYNVIKELVKYDCLNGYYASAQKINQSIHITAVVQKKYETLKVILKAVNGFEFEDEKSLIELISLSFDKLLSRYFVKNLNSHAINTQNDDGNTLLHFAVMHENQYLIYKILQKNPNLSIKNNENKTALDIASSFEDKNIFELLKDFELKKINEPNNSNQTFALKEDKFEIIEKQEKEKTTNKQQKKFELAYRLESEGCEFARITASWNPQEIKDYKKFKYSLEVKVETNEEQEVFSWVVDGKEYKSSDKNIFCHKYYNKDYYMTIDEALNTLKFSQKFGEFKKILKDQGFAKSEKGYDGVITDKNVWKIKDADEDDRLFSTKFWVDPKNNQTLIIFNQVGDHEKIPEIINSGRPMEKEVCKNPEVLIIEENNSESFPNDPIEPLGDQGVFNKLCQIKKTRNNFLKIDN